MAEHITERRAVILSLVVREHVRRAAPVASGALVRRYDLGCSAATVRSEMGALEDLGLLEQPHTSAGRVPTVAGYRYFVERLMRNADLEAAEKRTIRHQFHQAGWDPERWMRLSAAVVAQGAGAAGLVASPRDREAPLRRVELVDIGSVVHVVALMANGVVQQARWRPEVAVSQRELDEVATRINGSLAHGVSLDVADGVTGDARDVVSALPPLEREAREVVLELLGRTRRSAAPRLYHAGLSQILVAPEFAEGERLRAVVTLLEYGTGLESILSDLPRHGVQVIMGGEPPLEGVPYVTLILARFGMEATPAGVLGVVGPTRMPYERAVPTVDYVAGLMTRLLAGQPEPEAA